MNLEFNALQQPWREPQRAALIHAYLEYERTQSDQFASAASAIVAMTFFASAAEQWDVILEITREAPGDEKVLSAIAAGPLEGLLAQHGAAVIDWVEEETKRNPKFRRVLHGVWRSRMPEDVWRRVQLSRGPSRGEDQS